MKYFLPLFCIIGITICNAQTATNIKGRVLDADSKKPVAYANVHVFAINNSLINGVITDDQGVFHLNNIPPNAYAVKIGFIGYEQIVINNISEQSVKQNLGDIFLKVLPQNVDAVVVKGSRSAVTYKTDRKVINAENFPGANLAIDLLENIPSVQVNFEGKLSYRGEGTFKVYINGVAVANGEEKLRQIPAGQIDRIEIITNPSAKYDAQGIAGIIQVILKKNRMEGYIINAALVANSRGEYSALFAIDRKYKKAGWFINAQWNEYVWDKFNETENRQVKSGDEFYETLIDKKQENRERKSFVELGANFVLSQKDDINFSGYINPFQIKQKNKSIGNVSETVTDIFPNLTQQTALLMTTAHSNTSTTNL